MAAENIDNTVDGTGLINVKIPGLSDAADIQAALRLYHYGIYGYDGANTNPALLPNPSIAKYLKDLIDADAAEVTNRNAAITVHNTATTNVHGIANTANLATQAFVTTSITNAVNGATGGYPALAGEAIDWNSVDLRFDVEPRIANTGTITTKTESFTLSPDDVGKTAILYSSNPMTVTLPANNLVEIPVGYSIDIIQTGSGSVTVLEGTNAVSINSKSNIKSLDGQYSKGTLVKIDTNTWFFFGNLLNAVVPTPVAPTPTAPTPVAPTPVAPTPTAPTPVAPTPVAPTPVAPTPVAPTPVAPTPTAPTPTAPTPVAPTPVAPTPVAVTCGPCESYTTTAPTCNGEDSYVGNYSGTRKTCSDGSYEICTQPTLTGFGACIATQASGCGGTNANGPCAPTPVAPTPVPSCPSSNIYGITQGGVYSGSCPDGSCPGCTNYQDNWWKCSDGSSGVKFYTGLGCSTPTPTAPTPVAPTPVAPTPVAPTPVAPCQTFYCAAYGVMLCVGDYCPSNSPTPVAPTPTAPTPVAPTPVAPTPVAPTPVAPTPVAPTPVACTPGSDCGTTTNEATCKTTVREYNSNCSCVVVGVYNFC